MTPCLCPSDFAAAGLPYLETLKITNCINIQWALIDDIYYLTALKTLDMSGTTQSGTPRCSLRPLRLMPLRCQLPPHVCLKVVGPCS